jgi:hypothetical protein
VRSRGNSSGHSRKCAPASRQRPDGGAAGVTCLRLAKRQREQRGGPPPDRCGRRPFAPPEGLSSHCREGRSAAAPARASRRVAGALTLITRFRTSSTGAVVAASLAPAVPCPHRRASGSRQPLSPARSRPARSATVLGHRRPAAQCPAAASTAATARSAAGTRPRRDEAEDAGCGQARGRRAASPAPCGRATRAPDRARARPARMSRTPSPRKPRSQSSGAPRSSRTW